MHSRRRVLSTWTYKPDLAGDNIGNSFSQTSLTRVFLPEVSSVPLAVFSSAYISEESSRARWIFVGVKANKGHESSTPIWSLERSRSWRSMFVKSAPAICICMRRKSLDRPQSRERVEIGCRRQDSKNICALPKIDSYDPNVVAMTLEISSVVQYLRLWQSSHIHIALESITMQR